MPQILFSYTNIVDPIHKLAIHNGSITSRKTLAGLYGAVCVVLPTRQVSSSISTGYVGRDHVNT